MKGIERMRAQLGGHIRESVGAASTTGAGGPLPSPAATTATPYQGCTRPKDALTIEVTRLIPDPDQPRKEFDKEALEELARSLKARGQLQPIRVRWDAGRGTWVIVSGERRWRAATLAGLATLACVEVKGELTPDEILEDQLVENCLREDLKPIEQARAFKALLERRGCSYRQLAESLNISHMAISRALALLELPGAIQEQVEQGALSPSVAYEVAKLDDTTDQVEIADQIVTEKLTRDQAVEAVRARRTGKATPARRTKAKYRIDGTTITITGDALNAGPDAIIVALDRLKERILSEAREVAKSEAA